jgi:cell division protein FtsN
MSQYQFSFDRKRLILVVAGLLFAGVLTFCCGVITGIGLWMPAQKELAQFRGKPKVPGQSISAPTAVKLPEVKPPEVPGTAALTSAVKAQTVTPAVAAAPPSNAVTPAPAAAALAAPATGQPDTQPVAAAAPAAAPDPVNQPFVLQLGAFREQKNAKQLQADLKLKGYPTTICNMVDEDQRTWHMVRFGGYKDLSAASHAASDFTGKEGIQALVRRSDSL